MLNWQTSQSQISLLRLYDHSEAPDFLEYNPWITSILKSCPSIKARKIAGLVMPCWLPLRKFGKIEKLPSLAYLIMRKMLSHSPGWRLNKKLLINYQFTFDHRQVPRSFSVSSFKWVQFSGVLILKPGQNNPRYSWNNTKHVKPKAPVEIC